MTISSLKLNEKQVKSYKFNLFKQKIRAFSLVSPLLVFLFVFFALPIWFMLQQSFYNPKVVNLAPNTIKVLNEWKNVDSIPSEKAFETMAKELKFMYSEGVSGKFAEEINRQVSQTGSVIKKTSRKLKKYDLNDVDNFQNLMIEMHKSWGDIRIWQGIKLSGDPYTINYYAHSLDYELNTDGSLEKKPEDERIYVKVFGKTFKIALIITLLTILLGYPVSYYLAFISDKKANVLIIFVLLPFWTSLLVRTTAWIAILQTNGIVNQFLMYINVITEPLDIIFNQFSTVLSMTHILLPFMILPLYSVMKGIDKSYVKASQSLGANPFMSFIKVYLPLSMPGLSAGALLVFIIAIGYYITPALIGGVDGQLISNLVAYHMRSTNNWELAAALGSILLVSICVLYWIYDRIVGASNIKF